MSRRLLHAALALLTALSLAISPLYAQNSQAPAPDSQSQPQPQMQAPPIYQPPAISPTPPESPARHLDLGPNYSNGHSWFPHIIAPYTQMSVPKPNLANTPRIEQLISNGKMMLRLEDAVSLALENNLSVAVARYTPWLNEASLLYAKSGANGRLQFDPTLTGNFNLQDSKTPLNNPFFAGVGAISPTGIPVKTAPPSIVNHTFNANFQYTEGWAYGTQAQITFDNQRGSTNIPADLFNPFVQSTLTLQLTQPLLNGFGKIPNERYIIEARNTVKVGESQFEQQVMSTITAVATDYWELVFARENVKVEQVAVAADMQLYENNKKQLEIGTMAPLDVITAQSQLASDQQALVQAQTTQLLDETTLLVAITKNPLAIELKSVEIVPTTPLFSPAIEEISLEEAVKEAWQKRPELQQATLNLKNADVEVKATKNALLPTLNIFGEYQATGLGGIQRIEASNGTIVPNFESGQILNGAGVPQDLYEPLAETSLFSFPGGINDDLYRMITAGYPVFYGGLNLTLPIRNRAAQAQNATAQLNQRQQEVQYEQTQNTIVLNVRQALITLVQDKAAIAAAEQARVLAQQSYDDEVKRLQLGSSTAFTVVQKQQLLTSAQGTELRDRINLIEAQLNFEQSMGRTLEAHNITLADALNGSVSTTPNIPGTPDTAATSSHR